MIVQLYKFHLVKLCQFESSEFFFQIKVLHFATEKMLQFVFGRIDSQKNFSSQNRKILTTFRRMLEHSVLRTVSWAVLFS